MCNPRRVRVRLSRAVDEAWRTTVEQAATATAEVQEQVQAAADIPLATQLGDLPLRMIERLLRGDFEDYAAWERDGAGNYRRDLGEVTLLYRPGSRQLLVEARLSEQVTHEARAAVEAGGVTTGEVSAEGVGRYFDDNWGGRTEEDARRDAQAEAERRLAEEVEGLHRRAHQAEIAAAEREARARAEALAAEQLRRRQEEVRRALRGRLQGLLAAAEDRVRHAVNQLVGQAYRRSLVEVVRQNGGRVLADENTGSVINLELELF